jgi:hypothetical protein
VAVIVAEHSAERSHEKASASAGLLSVVSLKAAGELGSGRTSDSRNEVTSRLRFSVQLVQPGAVERRPPVRMPPPRNVV